MNKKWLNEINRKRLSGYKVVLHDDHPVPKTRRDFLKSGLLSFSGSIVLPNLIQVLLTDPALAAECNIPNVGVPVASPFVPFINVNMEGGSAMMMNYMPNDREGGVGGSHSGIDYSRAGLGSNPSANIITEFNGAPFFGGDASLGLPPSQILMGIRSKASAGTIANTAFIGMPAKSDNDTNDNRYDISGLVEKAGRIGQLLPIFANSDDDNQASTGLAQLPALGIAPAAPSIVSDAKQIFDAGGGGGGVNNQNDPIKGLNLTQKRALFKGLANLSGSQLAALQSTSAKLAAAELIDCATKTNDAIVSSVNQVNLDPRLDPSLSQVWGINEASTTSSESVLFASIVNLALNDLSSVGAIELGGYDYHGDGRTEPNQKDFRAGEVIGSALESAAALGKKCFIYVTSDGSVESEVGDEDYSEAGAWTGDESTTGGAYILAYDPAGRPATNGFQINSMTSNNAANTRSVITSSERQALAVFANYLKFSGQLDLFNSITNNALNLDQLNTIMRF